VRNITHGSNIRGRIQKFPDWVDNEITNNNKKTLTAKQHEGL
jgi:hypothetical protein